MLTWAELVGLPQLTRLTAGSPDIPIGIIDGPVFFEDPAFEGRFIKPISRIADSVCDDRTRPACNHGTFVAATLIGGGNRAGICPECPVLVRSVFSDRVLSEPVSATVEDLSSAIAEATDAGCRVLNLSLAVAPHPHHKERLLSDALTYACSRDVVIVAASGNRGQIGRPSVLMNHAAVIPVAACDGTGRAEPYSNLGRSVGARGLLAPGNLSPDVVGEEPIQGTSVSAPVVTGALALLWSLFPFATSAEIRHWFEIAHPRRRTIMPPLLDSGALLSTALGASRNRNLRQVSKAVS